jgi:hypothetical protein
MGAELFDADRQTDMTKLIVAFRSFANAPKIVTKDKNFCWTPASSLTLGDAVEFHATAPYCKLDPSKVCAIQQRGTENITGRIKPNSVLRGESTWSTRWCTWRTISKYFQIFGAVSAYNVRFAQSELKIEQVGGFAAVKTGGTNHEWNLYKTQGTNCHEVTVPISPPPKKVWTAKKGRYFENLSTLQILLFFAPCTVL